MMKNLLFLFIFISGYSQTANFTGHVIEKKTETGFPGVTVELNQEGKVVYETQTDFDGNYTIKNVKLGAYEFKLKLIGYQDFVIKDFYISQNRALEFIFPNPCKESVKICPKNHTDKLIPIVYGMPGEKLIKKAKKGKVMLGGCIVTDCDPKWYCKVHKIEF
jgi:hypothetical protein